MERNLTIFVTVWLLGLSLLPAQMRHGLVKLSGKLVCAETQKCPPEAWLAFRNLSGDYFADTIPLDSLGNYQTQLVVREAGPWQILASADRRLPLIDTLWLSPDSASWPLHRDWALAPDLLTQLEEIVPVSFGRQVGDPGTLPTSLDQNIINYFYRLSEELDRDWRMGIEKRLEIFPLLSESEEEELGAELGEYRAEKVIRELIRSGIREGIITRHRFTPELREWFRKKGARGIENSEGSILYIGIRTLR